MKYLSIDYGTKRVGLATSDDGGVMAFPLRVLLNSRSLAAHIAKICRDERINVIVMGESLNFQNKHNSIMGEIIPFVGKLKNESGLPVVYMNEVLSSQEAMHLQGDNKENDSSAAAIVLQSYLDKINPKKADTEDEQE